MKKIAKYSFEYHGGLEVEEKIGWRKSKRGGGVSDSEHTLGGGVKEEEE